MRREPIIIKGYDRADDVPLFGLYRRIDLRVCDIPGKTTHLFASGIVNRFVTQSCTPGRTLCLLAKDDNVHQKNGLLWGEPLSTATGSPWKDILRKPISAVPGTLPQASR